MGTRSIMGPLHLLRDLLEAITGTHLVCSACLSGHTPSFFLLLRLTWTPLCFLWLSFHSSFCLSDGTIRTVCLLLPITCLWAQQAFSFSSFSVHFLLVSYGYHINDSNDISIPTTMISPSLTTVFSIWWALLLNSFECLKYIVHILFAWHLLFLYNLCHFYLFKLKCSLYIY